MRLTVVGCAGTIPRPYSSASCYLLEAEGFRLVVDLGSGSLGPLQRYAAINQVDAVALSHLHADHFIDMCSFWVARKYSPEGTLPRVPVYGPADTAGRVSRANDDPDVTGIFDFVTLAPGRREIGPFTVTVDHVAHPVETFAFRFEHDGRVLAYSGDTGESPALVEIARSADVLLCESGSLTSGPSAEPASVQPAGRPARRRGRGRETGPHAPGPGLRPGREPGRGAGHLPRSGIPGGPRPGHRPGVSRLGGPGSRPAG